LIISVCKKIQFYRSNISKLKNYICFNRQMHSFKNDYRGESTHEKSLGSIVLYHFIVNLKSTEGIIPEIMLTNQGKLAKKYFNSYARFFA